MFGNKAPFGSNTSFPSTSFGTATPFGQNTSAFGGNKSLGTSFGMPAFGAAPPNNTVFNTSAAPAGNIFGGVSSSFGQPGTSTSTFGFPATSSAATGLFGNTAQTATGSSLFQSPTSSAFGAPKSTFGGFGATSSTGLFGQNQQPSTLFGQNASASTGLFGTSGSTFSSAFGAAAPGTTNGTTVKFSPVTGSDTMLKNGVTSNISIRHQCITVMKEYENKSLEELRVEDYLANRKGPQSTIGGFGAANQTSMFGTNQPAASTGLFQNQNKSLFGSAFGTTPGTSTVFGQPAAQQPTGLFGQKNMAFGTPSTTAPSFSFGTSTAPTMFGSTATTQNKSLFGTTNPTSTPSLFGTTNTLQQGNAFGSTGFNSTFGTPNQTGGGLFGPKPFGTPTTSASAFAFGNTTNSNVGASLFPNKTNTGFGAGNTFGTPTSNFDGFKADQPNTATSVLSELPNDGQLKQSVQRLKNSINSMLDNRSDVVRTDIYQSIDVFSSCVQWIEQRRKESGGCVEYDVRQDPVTTSTSSHTLLGDCEVTGDPSSSIDVGNTILKRLADLETKLLLATELSKLKLNDDDKVIVKGSLENSGLSTKHSSVRLCVWGLDDTVSGNDLRCHLEKKGLKVDKCARWRTKDEQVSQHIMVTLNVNPDVDWTSSTIWPTRASVRFFRGKTPHLLDENVNNEATDAVGQTLTERDTVKARRSKRETD